MYKLIKITKSDKPDKKMMAVFKNLKTDRENTTHFGSKGMSDFTKHKDPERKERYIKRHKVNEDWNKPTSAGALSRWILWNKPTLSASIKNYKEKFNFVK